MFNTFCSGTFYTLVYILERGFVFFSISHCSLILCKKVNLVNNNISSSGLEGSRKTVNTSHCSISRTVVYEFNIFHIIKLL